MMVDKGYKQFRVDNEFRVLIRPLSREEYAQLEANIVLYGCRDPITTWNGTIVDGHNRYEICNRLHIPYASQEIDFESREEVISWICSTQLGRRNITEETRKYLIGKQYEAEKVVSCSKNAKGYNQYRRPTNNAAESCNSSSCEQTESKFRTANRLGAEYHLSSGTVQKYARYSQALDEISSKAPDLVPKILSGSYKISHENIVALSAMNEEQVKKLHSKIGLGSTPSIRYSESRQKFQGENVTKPIAKIVSAPAIKTMPAYDPDSEVVGLTLTIPSWISSIDRLKASVDLSICSAAAKSNLERALNKLRFSTQDMISCIRRDCL